MNTSMKILVGRVDRDSSRWENKCPCGSSSLVTVRRKYCGICICSLLGSCSEVVVVFFLSIFSPLYFIRRSSNHGQLTLRHRHNKKRAFSIDVAKENNVTVIQEVAAGSRKDSFSNSFP